MLHRIRKTAILVLCLVLVCGLSITALAETEPHHLPKVVGGGVTVTTYAEIHRYDTMGQIKAVKNNNYDMATDTTVWMTFRYFDTDLNQVSDDLGCDNKGIAWVQLTLGADEAFAMIEADYDFRAYVHTPSETIRYSLPIINMRY